MPKRSQARMVRVDPEQVWAFVDGLIEGGERDSGRLLLKVHQHFGDAGIALVMSEIRARLGENREQVWPGNTVRYVRQWRRWLGAKAGEEGATDA
jgi:hypothetical protein